MNKLLIHDGVVYYTHSQNLRTLTAARDTAMEQVLVVPSDRV